MPNAPHALITLGDVGKKGIPYDRLAHMDLSGRVGNQALSLGDVLIRPRGSHFGAAVVSEMDRLTVAVAPLYVLKIKTTEANPDYVAWWINRDEQQKLLLAQSHGTHMPTVPKEGLERLQIELPPVATQEMIVEIIDLRNRKRELLRKLEDLEDTFAEQMIENALGLHLKI